MAAAPQPASKAALLNSWKEIASYLGRGVRTAQRYEHDLKLPVRRPRGKSRSAVIAFTTELDEWLRNTPKSALDSASAKTALPHVVTALHESLREKDDLWQICKDLRSANLEAIRTLHETVLQMRELLRVTRQAREELTSVREDWSLELPCVRHGPTKPN